MDGQRDSVEFAIIGGGPAGVAAAYDLVRRGRRPVLFEQDDQVGGLSRTVNHHGYRFDIGGHRFFTKSREVESLWHEVLGEDFLRRPRLSRIFYRGRLFHYPLKPMNALLGLGPLKSLRVLLSFLRRRVFPTKPETSFEDWVANRFGYVLYSIFFKTYTEKVWGISCRELSADWAAQRIRNLDLGQALLKALGIGRARRDVASLIEEFDYPKFGPGQMYETMAEKAASRGADVRLNHRVTKVGHDRGRITSVETATPRGSSKVSVERLISTMPLSELVLALAPPVPDEVLDAAKGLRYRSILTVNFVVDLPELLPDTWVYLHAPEVRAGRLQLYKNWSPFMVEDPSKSTLGLEYFCFEGDEFWTAGEPALVEIGKVDLRTLRLVDLSLVRNAFVVRYPKAYPMYDTGYSQRLHTIRTYLEGFPNLVCAGRYGQFRYNNMDHSIMSSLLGVRRLLGEGVDPWAVNVEAEYHEETSSRPAEDTAPLPSVPT